MEGRLSGRLVRPVGGELEVLMEQGSTDKADKESGIWQLTGHVSIQPVIDDIFPSAKDMKT